MTPQIAFKTTYSEEDRRMVQRINAWLMEPGKTGADLSRMTDIKDGTRSSILTGAYISSPTKFLQRMIDAIDRVEERNQAAKNDIPYTETSVALQIEAVCKRTHVDRDFGVFCGKVGVGKTTALRCYARKTQSAVLLEAFEGIDNSTFIQELITATGSVAVKGTQAMQMAGLIKSLRGSDRVILVDEANWLPKRSFGALRRISDVAEIGVVLVGTAELLPMVQDPEGRFGQISSRIGFWPALAKQISEKDCAMLVTSYCAEELPDAVLKSFYGCCEGSARTLKNLLKNTYRYANKNNAEITPELIKRINQQAMAGRGFVTGGV
ncbi:MAG: ATP-binding protein [Methylobacter tundripaludum]|nr:ATP-binding protein [Methylobacter tundripaludum]